MAHNTLAVHVLNMISQRSKGQQDQFKYKVPDPMRDFSNPKKKLEISLPVDTNILKGMVEPSHGNPALPFPPSEMDTLVLNGQSGYSKGAIREDSKVGYTFALVLSQPLTRLTEVRQYGDLKPPTFDDILKIPYIRKLIVRSLHGYGPAELIGSYGDYDHDEFTLSFAPLIHNSTLRHLEVGKLRANEADSLASTVKTLAQLELLHVSADSRSLCGPMNTFLKAISDNSRSGLRGFPAELQSLTLIEEGDGHENRTLALLEYVRPTNRTHLTIGAVRDDNLGDKDGNEVKAELYALWDFVQTLPCMKQLQFSKAWQASKFLQKLRGLKKMQQFKAIHVVITSLPPPPPASGSPLTPKEIAKIPASTSLHTRLLGNNSWQYRWGTEIEIVCLNNVDLETIQIDDISSYLSDAGFQSLKALVLKSTPKYARGIPDWFWTLEHDEGYGREGQAVLADYQETGVRIIAEAIHQFLDKLRVLSIDGCIFFVEHERGLTIGARNAQPLIFRRKAIQMRDALNEPRYRAILDSEVDDRVWDAVTQSGRPLSPHAEESLKRAADKVVLVKIATAQSDMS